MNTLIAFLLLLTTIPPIQFEVPATREGFKIYNHKNYTLSYNEEFEVPNWVAYELVKNELTKNVDRKDDFRSDPTIETKSCDEKDYVGSGFDRGHMMPAADCVWDSLAMSESFYMSNMTPQHPSFNRGIWKQCEEYVRYLSSIHDTVWVVSGCVFDKQVEFIGGENKIGIPSKFYKAVLFRDNYDSFNFKTIGWIFDNKKSEKELFKHRESIDWIEIISGEDLFHNLDDKIENKIEFTRNYDKYSKGSLNQKIEVKTEKVEQEVKPTRSYSSSVQCNGRTKKGRRCKRMTTSENGYCWQHSK